MRRKNDAVFRGVLKGRLRSNGEAALGIGLVSLPTPGAFSVSEKGIKISAEMTAPAWGGSERRSYSIVRVLYRRIVDNSKRIY